MLSGFINTMCTIMRYIGIPSVFRIVFATNRITIINYHNPTVEVFEKHMTYFNRKYAFIAIHSLLDSIENHDFSKLPRNPMLVTIDDGYIDNRNLLPTIKKYHIPVVLYMIAGYINTDKKFWFDYFEHNSVQLHDLKEIDDSRRREIISSIESNSKKSNRAPALVLSVDDLSGFVKMGCTIGSHSVSHPIMTKCSEKIGVMECIQSKKILEELLPSEEGILHFALPNGIGNETTRSWVRKAGYKTCRTLRYGWATEDTDPLCLPDFGIADNASLNKAIIQAAGIWGILRAIFRRNKGKVSKEVHFSVNNSVQGKVN